FLQVERGASPHTLRNYEGDLRQFLAFLQTAHNGSLPVPTAVDAYGVRGFLAARAGVGDAKSSLGRKLATIRSLFKYLAREGVVPHSPAAAVVTPEQEQKLPRVLAACGAPPGADRRNGVPGARELPDDHAAHPPPVLCDPPPGRRRGPARDPGAARPRLAGHDPALHTRGARPADGGLRQGPSAGA